MNITYFSAGDSYNPFTNSYMPITIEREKAIRYNVPTKTTVEGEDWIAITTGLVHDPNTSAVDLDVLMKSTSNPSAEPVKLIIVEGRLGDGVKPKKNEVVHFNERGLQGVYYIHKDWLSPSEDSPNYLNVSGKFITTTLTPDKLNEKNNPHLLHPRDLRNVLNTNNVKDTFKKLREISEKGDFECLRLGDYIDLVDGFNDGEGFYSWKPEYENLRVQIVAFDHYYRVGATDNTKHHVVMQFKNCYKRKRLHSSATSSGGYVGKELQVFLNGSFKTGLVNAIGIEPIEIERLLDIATGDRWFKERVFLPTEVEVIGHQAWGQVVNKYYLGEPTGTSMQYPIFSIAPQSRIKFIDDKRNWWWTASPAYYGEYFKDFVGIGDKGYPESVDAPNQNISFAPCFCI